MLRFIRKKIWGYKVFHPYNMAKTLVKFSNWIFFQKCSENFQSRIFFKHAQNVEICKENESGFMKFFTYTKWPKTCEILKLEIFSKILRMSRFIRGIKLGLGSLSTIQNGQNTCENSQTEFLFKNAKNVEIYQGNKSGNIKFFTHTNCQKLIKIFKLRIFSNMLRTLRFVRGDSAPPPMF